MTSWPGGVRSLRSSVVAVALQVLAGGFDGVWCSPDGRHIAVDGLNVITPGGQPATGTYYDLDFAFPVDSGAVIWMQMIDGNTARVSTVAEGHNEPPPHDRWRRCDVTS